VWLQHYFQKGIECAEKEAIEAKAKARHERMNAAPKIMTAAEAEKLKLEKKKNHDDEHHHDPNHVCMHGHGFEELPDKILIIERPKTEAVVTKNRVKGT
tara:strand:+ start:448 stop:744 length:297 start_codon:yes stop_codon:yes gene_type:complete